MTLFGCSSDVPWLFEHGRPTDGTSGQAPDQTLDEYSAATVIVSGFLTGWLGHVSRYLCNRFFIVRAKLYIWQPIGDTDM